uniref:hypothetical protein n=1 Tax=Paractinoplanes polyasparticus TaxID=2856853 RepID=UPI001C8468A5|nr:hypothetical protein [Actinoplanes polyasparticus]
MSAPKRHDRLSDDPSGELRRYIGVFLIFCGVAPLLMFSGLASKVGEPDFPALPIFVAAPFIVAGVVVTVLGIAAKDPKRSARRVGIGAVLIVLGDLLIFGIRAGLV